MKKFVFAAALVLTSAPAMAQYYGGGGYGGGYHAPRYRNVCTYEQVWVTPPYGGGYYENRRVCRRVQY